MPFVIETAGEVLVVAVVGQLVVGNRQEFKQTVIDEVERGARRVLIDFTETGYVDSSDLMRPVYSATRQQMMESMDDLWALNASQISWAS